MEFLKNLLETPSASGYEQPVAAVVRDRMKPYADEIETDYHGNVIASLNPQGSPRVMFAGHCDQISFMIQHVDDKGYLFVNAIGGHDMMVVVGQAVTVWADKGPVPGVMARKPIHLLQGDANKPKMTDLWVDIGAKSKKEAERLVEIGDPVTWRLGMSTLRNDLLVSPGMDDKVGTWVVMEALRLLKGRAFEAAVFAVATVQEEIGLRGAKTSAFGIDPQIGLAVDVTFCTDHPDMDSKQTGEVKLHEGAVITRGPNINPKVCKLLVETAKQKKIPHQLCGESRPTGTDANAIQLNRAGVATGLVSVPNRYMHSPVEVVSARDLEACAKLLAEFVCRVDAETDFRP
jgi:endoglucanase